MWRGSHESARTRGPRKDLQRNFCFYGFATVQWSLGPAAGQVVKTHAFLWLVEEIQRECWNAERCLKYL